MSRSDEERFHSALLAALGPEMPAPDRAQLRVMFAYYEGVVEANRRFNLTRIVGPAEAAVKHFADSISVLGWVKTAGVRPSNVLDVGTGAGFPAVPLAVMRPDWTVTAIDSTAKKVRFVVEMSARLDLKNLTAEQGRAGEWQPSRAFALVTCKAVGDLRRCVEQSRHLVQRDGHVIAYKTGTISEDEREAGLRVARRHQFAALEPYAYRLRLGDETIERALWVFRKL